ncbi:hypothetical protein FHR92_001046 [Fontibacillus solani]|uniref:Uncharacterized protein n=1 Tax=Fontibacillus solani TaxID=1572857 RepID=A0A7W3XQK6_9BACL|nr:hypothetical protein [Fontibacillus solani]MBA9084589.1 hypothetical protein [Fontibacillus solani]
MSLFCAAFYNNNQELAIAADTRVCSVIEGVQYQISDDMTKLYSNGKGLYFYCSGEAEMSKDVAEQVLQLKEEYIHTHSILEILEKTYTKHTKLNPAIKDYKHTLQFVIPVQENGLWRVIYFDNENSFKPYVYSADSNEVYVFAIGKGMHLAQPILNKALNDTDASKKSIFETFLNAYSEATDSGCGGTMNYVAFTNKGLIEKFAPITDRKQINKLADSFPHLKHGQGDGMILNPDGSSKSGTANVSKPEGMWQFIYYNSNYARETAIVSR